MASNCFLGVEDRFGGIVVDSQNENVEDCAQFRQKLLNSMQSWKTLEKRGIWFKVYLANSSWIPILVENSFVFHHAQPEYVMMVRWLPEDESCAIPRYPHNYVGVGAFVVNDKDEVLVVKERYYIDKPIWKIPGGYVECGEELGDAAEREVFEETGIKAKFVSLVAFRHIHKVQFKCSDLYFVCRLQPLSETILKCERELLECKWMPVHEYCNDPEGSTINQYIAKCYSDNNVKEVALSPTTIKFRGRSQNVYSIKDSGHK